eukprot:SAG11_NODE_10864_length_800_cov_1.222539_1_plen_46_part_01
MGKIRNATNVYFTDRIVVLGTTIRERYKFKSTNKSCKSVYKLKSKP